MPTRIKEYLQNIIPPEHRWKIKLLKNWHKIIGSMSDKVILERIVNDQLFLGVTHPAWAQELSFFSTILKKKINAFLKENRISTIRFRVVQKASQTGVIHRSYLDFIHNQNNLQKKASKEYSLSNKEKKILRSMHNKELQNSMKNFLIRCREIKGESKNDKKVYNSDK